MLERAKTIIGYDDFLDGNFYKAVLSEFMGTFFLVFYVIGMLIHVFCISSDSHSVHIFQFFECGVSNFMNFKFPTVSEQLYYNIIRLNSSGNKVSIILIASFQRYCKNFYQTLHWV